MNQPTKLNKHILLIDDEKLIRKAYHDGLTTAGFQLTEAENGQQAWQKVQDIKPDLIMLDLIMPEMDGFGFLEKIKQDQKLAQIPVVVLTVSGQAHDLERSKKLGASDYLVKTDYSMAEVINRIKFHLN